VLIFIILVAPFKLAHPPKGLKYIDPFGDNAAEPCLYTVPEIFENVVVLKSF